MSKKQSTSGGGSSPPLTDIYGDLKALFEKNDSHISILGEGISPSEPSLYLPSPISLLNYSLGGDGFPYGKVAEISGPEQTGKSALILALLAENQRIGGISVYIDTESATSKKTAKDLAGVNEDELFIANVKTFENAVNAIRGTIEKLRTAYPARPIAIAVDSVAGLQSKMEQEASFEEQIQLGVIPRLIRKFFRQCCEEFADSNTMFLLSNHEIANIGAKPWEKKYITLGGSGIKYWASTRIRLQNAGYIKEDKIVRGINVRATIIKTRNAAPERQVEIVLNLTPPHRGFDDAMTTFKYLHEQKYFGGAYGGWYTYNDQKYREESIIKHLRDGTEIGNALKHEARKLFETGWAYDAIDPLAEAEIPPDDDVE